MSQSNEQAENLTQLEYALAKQIPLGSDTLKINSNFGELALEGELGRKAIQALRLVLIHEAKAVHKSLVRGGK